MSDDTTAVPAPFDMPDSSAPFEARGGWVLNRLIADFGLSAPQAAGIVGNLGYESGGFKELQEIRPLAGRGGWGWAQWTSSRRTAMERWCADHDLDPASDEANYGYLCLELRTTQAHAIEQVRKTSATEAAVFTFGVIFERPAGTTATHLPAYEARLAYAKRALAGALGLHAAPATPAAPSAADPDHSADALNAAELAQIKSTVTPEAMPVPALAPAAAPPAAPLPPPQRPVHTAIAATGIASAVVVSIVWLLSLDGVAVPDQVQAAWAVIITALGAGLLHWRPSLAAFQKGDNR